jgi:hypothetical protein
VVEDGSCQAHQHTIKTSAEFNLLISSRSTHHITRRQPTYWELQQAAAKVVLNQLGTPKYTFISENDMKLRKVTIYF